MSSHLSNPWTNAVTYLELKFGNQCLAKGSGFFWASGEQTFLVTNWHNLSGRDPSDHSPLSSHGGLPDRVTFTVYRRTSEPDANGYFSLEVRIITVPLCDNDLSNPRWFQHPSFGSKVDVAVIDVTNALRFDGAYFNHVNVLEGDANVEPFVSQDVFIVGYPLGLVTGVPIPVQIIGDTNTNNRGQTTVSHKSIRSLPIEPPVRAQTPQQWGVLFDSDIPSPADARQ